MNVFWHLFGHVVVSNVSKRKADLPQLSMLHGFSGFICFFLAPPFYALPVKLL